MTTTITTDVITDVITTATDLSQDNSSSESINDMSYKSLCDKSNLIDDHKKSPEYMDGIVHVTSKVNLYDDIASRAMKELNEGKSLTMLTIYAKKLYSVGYDFPNVLPFLLKCFEYAKNIGSEKLLKFTYEAIEWNTGWYSGTQNHPLLSFEQLKTILMVTSGMNQRLINCLLRNLDPNQKKFDLIEQGYLVTLNEKKVVKDSICTAVNESGLCEGRRKDNHSDKICTCYCSCTNCWHTICTITYFKRE